MKKGSITAKIIITTLSISLVAISARAESLPIRPSFPSCKSPQGVVKVSYDSGIHGVPGDYATYTGKDTVYSLSEITLTQCLCSTNGKGVQTNWWRISSLSFEEIESLKKLGWAYVPDGSAWGLEEGPYMTQSSTYSCSDPGNKDNNDDDDDDNDSKKSKRIGGGQVLAASTYLGDILGLANTGNTFELVSYISVAFVSLALSTYLIIKRAKK